MGETVQTIKFLKQYAWKQMFYEKVCGAHKAHVDANSQIYKY